MTERMSAAEYLAIPKAPPRSKYGNIRTDLDGHTFDSKAEARYYAMLRLRELAGEVREIEHQVPFSLRGQNGEVVATYKADFVFWDCVEGRQRVIDVKGGRGTVTPLFKLKAKLLRATHGLSIEIEDGRS